MLGTIVPIQCYCSHLAGCGKRNHTETLNKWTSMRTEKIKYIKHLWPGKNGSFFFSGSRVNCTSLFSPEINIETKKKEKSAFTVKHFVSCETNYI